MMGAGEESLAFEASVLSSDIAQLERTLDEFFTGVKPSQWERSTHKGRKALTLRELLAHMAAAAELIDTAMEATVQGRTWTHPMLHSREDLAAWSAAEIQKRQGVSPEVLQETLLDALTRTARRAVCVSPDVLTRSVNLHIYDRPMPLPHLVGAQLAHVGVAHAAEVARAAGASPLWHEYPPDVIQRQITRYLTLAAYGYTPGWLDGAAGALQLSASGEGGGTWVLSLTADGAHAYEGRADRPSCALWARSPDTLCRIMTGDLPLLRAAVTGRMTVYGDRRLVKRLPELIEPPPVAAGD